MDSHKPLPGDFGLTNITGPVGWFINIGQLIIGDQSRYGHAFIVISDTEIIEARPFGAKRLSIDTWNERLHNTAYSNYPLTDDQRHEIVMAAISLEGTPYSYLDYFAIAFDRSPHAPKWLKNKVRARVKGSGHLICSQLVDLCYLRAGVHLFKDGRDPGNVSPGDLAYSNHVVFPEDR